MNHTPFIIASYAVFAAFLLWDWLAPKLQLRAALRAVRQRAARLAARGAPKDLER